MKFFYPYMFLTIRATIEEVNFSYHLGCQLKNSLLHYSNYLNIITQKCKETSCKAHHKAHADAKWCKKKTLKIFLK